MLAKLRNASIILHSALNDYLDASLAVGSQHESGHPLESDFDVALDELNQIDIYESMIEQSRKALRKFRNHCSTIAPINTLPLELLDRIFHLTVPTEFSSSWREDSNALLEHSPRSPESLLHVCSYWRAITLGSHGLWTYIYIAPFTQLSKELNRSARLCTAHSGQLPLHIHVNLNGPDNCSQNARDAVNLVASCAKRANSFDLEYDFLFGYDEVNMLETFITNCTLGNLARLAIWPRFAGSQPAFVVADDAPFEGFDAHECCTLDMPHSRLEEILSNVTILRLDSVFPRWTSQVYHGLVKLHLTCSSSFCLSLSELAGILSASPKLRFLYLETAIDEDSEPSPVHLKDLEVLHLYFDCQVENILRLILPGPNPLRISTIVHGHDLWSDILTGGEYKRFFTRSNITQLKAVGVGRKNKTGALDLHKLLGLVPNLQTLTLVFFNLELPLGSVERPSCYRLAELRLTGSRLQPDVLHRVIKSYPALKVYIAETPCWTPSEDRDYACMDQWKEDLLEIYPRVQFIEDANPADEDWD